MEEKHFVQLVGRQEEIKLTILQARITIIIKMPKNKKKTLQQMMLDEIMELPKVSFVLAGIGFLTILYSFITLSNPFFLITGIFAGLVFFYWAYDYWYKKLIDKKIDRLTQRMDDVVLEVYKS